MPRASQDYSAQDYGYIKRAASLQGIDIRQWITLAAVETAKRQLVDDARELLETLSLLRTLASTPSEQNRDQQQ